MLDIEYIRENTDAVKQNIKNRNMKGIDVDRFLELDEKRRDLQVKLDEMRAEQNKKSKGKPSPEEIKNLKKLSDKIKELEDKHREVLAEHKEIWGAIPNMAHPDAPVGEEKDFAVLETIGKPTKFDFKPKDHEELMTNLDLIDFERGAKVAGSKFYFVKNDAVRLNQALLNYGMDILEKHGFTIMETPDMAHHKIMDGAGFNPRGDEENIYNIEGEDLSLIGTAEVTILGYHADEILDLSAGPIKYAALSHCFRKEAGSYGKTSKGIYRVHQFTKLEMFVFCKPDQSTELHKELLGIEREIVDGLEIPYQIIDTPTGDLGAPAYRKYDIEAWMTMKDESGGYGEITSTSNCLDYQARRLGIKYRDENENLQHVHTLNGTAVVLSRFPVAIIENFQNEDGTINIPNVIIPYFGKDRITKLN